MPALSPLTEMELKQPRWGCHCPHPAVTPAHSPRWPGPPRAVLLLAPAAPFQPPGAASIGEGAPVLGSGRAELPADGTAHTPVFLWHIIKTICQNPAISPLSVCRGLEARDSALLSFVSWVPSTRYLLNTFHGRMGGKTSCGAQFIQDGRASELQNNCQLHGSVLPRSHTTSSSVHAVSLRSLGS